MALHLPKILVGRQPLFAFMDAEIYLNRSTHLRGLIPQMYSIKEMRLLRLYGPVYHVPAILITTRAKQSERLQDRPMLIGYLHIFPKSNRKSIGDTFTNTP